MHVGMAGVVKSGAPEVWLTAELSLEKTSYTSTSTTGIISRDAPVVINSVIVALLMTVVSRRIKSSAVCVSALPGLGCRDNGPSRTLGLPMATIDGLAH